MTQTRTPAYRPLPDKPVISEPQQNRRTQFFLRLLPAILLFFMVCAILLLYAVLPLRGLWFFDSLTQQLGSWTVLPTHVLFPRLQLTLGQSRRLMPLALSTTWKEAGLLMAAFALILFLYVLAIYVLSSRVARRFILLSTALLGILLVLCATVK